MAEILNSGEASHGIRRRGVKGMKKHSNRIDMTPMVDLGFLLITFFVFTAQLSQPASVNLNMPADGGEPTPLGKSNALTILLDKDNKVFYYEGAWEDAYKNDGIKETNFSYRYGLGNIVRAKQQYLDKHPINGEGRSGLMLLIKASDESIYSNLIDALDEALINEVKRYAIVDITAEEEQYLLGRH